MDIIQKRAFEIVRNELVIPSGACSLILQDAITGKIKSVDYIKNLVTSAGKASMADGLRGTESTKGVITYCALGTDATAPDAANTVLGTEIARKLVSVRSVAANIATFQTFFTTAEGNGTLREAGLFGDSTATGVVDTGTLFCHLAISRTKTSGDTLTLSWAVTIG